ncbi:MAG: DNA gyrase inhibitor YacG [Nitrospira sp.]|nr:DNA gyrase inhibitor YacG [Nitrospira sp.]HNA85056.1 DNA gyrase inhibitor YacG [Nitrospira sp.]
MQTSPHRCPECHQATAWKDNPWRPFCSERCQLIDLGAWAGEQYRVPGPSLSVSGTESFSPDSE